MIEFLIGFGIGVACVLALAWYLKKYPPNFLPW
jgi:hypothetical protein